MLAQYDDSHKLNVLIGAGRLSCEDIPIFFLAVPASRIPFADSVIFEDVRHRNALWNTSFLEKMGSVKIAKKVVECDLLLKDGSFV